MRNKIDPCLMNYWC